MVSKEQETLLNKQNILAVVWGIAALYIGAILLYLSFFEKLLTALNIDPVFGFVNLSILAIIYGLSGWIVVKKAQTKAWSFAIIPALVMFLYVSLVRHDITLPPESVYDWLGLPFAVGIFSAEPWTESVNEVFFIGDIYIVATLIISSLLGGVVAKHLQMKWK